MVSWNKGLTKQTSPSLLKTSQTMKFRGLDNFSMWRKKMKESGKIKDSYPSFVKGGNLAELMGVVLGDGHIWKYPRTEELSIFSNANNSGFVERYSNLVYKVFNKNPTVKKHSGENCIRIRIYEKNISKRLGVPVSPRKDKKIIVPNWILKDNRYIFRYLRGLYEAEGSYSVHKETYTYKFLFSNKNESMLENVYFLLNKIGFHPHLGTDKIQISRKDEVVSLMELIKFRKY